MASVQALSGHVYHVAVKVEHPFVDGARSVLTKFRERGWCVSPRSRIDVYESPTDCGCERGVLQLGVFTQLDLQDFAGLLMPVFGKALGFIRELDSVDHWHTVEKE